jgi:hypothetical protein
VRRLLISLLVLSLVAAAPASAEPPPIDDYAYDHATHCVKRPMPGALALVDWLERNARGVSWGIMRCEKWGKKRASLHAEGRAVDWHLDVARPADRRAARALIDRLLATDRLGNPHALARRMGIQEIIWNCRSWWSGAERMGPYSTCYDRKGKLRKDVDRTTAHRDHIHFGLSLAGACKRTSFWRPPGRDRRVVRGWEAPHQGQSPL